MNYGIWLKGLIFTILLESYEHCKYTGKNPDGFSVADCSNENLQTLPDDLPTDIQIVDLSRNPNLVLPPSFLETYVDTLVRLNLSGNLFAYRHSFVPNDPALLTFSKLINLEELDYSDSELTNEYQWVLPVNLIKYRVDNNFYDKLDVHWCKKLEHLSINDNRLNALPKFGLPLPPLNKLYARGNPLNNLTLLDLAPFCELSVLELDFPEEAYLAKEDGFCDCTLLKNWTKEVKIIGLENLNCSSPKSNKTNQPQCSNELLNQARKMRRTCPLLKRSSTAQVTHILKIIFLVIVLMILIATLILFIIRRLHLRARIRGTTKIEEEED